jgi:hypothetical protein
LRSPAVVAVVLLLAAGLAGCGLASGGGGGDVRVLVTRDFGARLLDARIVQHAPGSATPRGLLRAVTASAGAGGWSLYVNGVEQGGTDAGKAGIDEGSRIWWDRHPPSAAAPGPAAVVGSFPEPFLHGTGGRRYPLVLECAADAAAPCAQVAARLAAVGAPAARQALGTGAGQKTLRVLVGPWRELRGDAALEQLDRGPAAGGVFVGFTAGGAALELLDARGAVARTLGAGAGLLAATRFEQQAPTWAVTGTDLAGVRAAAAALDERRLARRFALAVGPAGDVPLPAAFRGPGR